MNEIILKIQNLSKQYQLGLLGTGTLSHDLNRWWHKIRGKTDPYIKIGQNNNLNHQSTSRYVWALKEINIDICRGDIIGIIGKNGAGKSTLLKILSKVTGPSTGTIKSKGSISSLLEVGTGFHPEMTGRENIFLNGAILGMTKREIERKLDAIIDFSDCKRYIDTPVKRYSSGMKVRLAFSVAAFLETEILIIDEVLAVGDAEFQKKALGKIQDISINAGKTILFVSHDMAAIQNLCSRVIVLKNGKIEFNGSVSDGIFFYLNNQVEESKKVKIKNIADRKGSGSARFLDAKFAYIINDKTISNTLKIPCGSKVFLDLEIKNLINDERNVSITVIFQDTMGVPITHFSNIFSRSPLCLKKNKSTIRFELEELIFVPGNYSITLIGFDSQGKFDHIENCLTFEIIESDFYGTGKFPRQTKLGRTLLRTKHYNIE